MWISSRSTTRRCSCGWTTDSTESGVFEVKRVEHTPAAVIALMTRISEFGPDPAEARVVVEISHGVVEQLLDAGFTVVPVNPDLIAWLCGRARKKDDGEDARIACLLALGAEFPRCGR